jgi:uncharacterized protein YdeI (YjbR/CyaY-like superfamily)
VTKDATRELLKVGSRQEWRDWLAANHQIASGIWLVVYKKNSGKPRLSYNDAVEEALCFGWIDSQANTLDGERFKLHFSTRRAASVWAQSNKERVARLIEQGLMTESGQAMVEQAKADGSWNALDEIDALAIPDDLSEALAADMVAEANFMAFSGSSKKMILYWIASAKRPETRAKRIAETAAQAHDNIKANHYRQ